MLEGQAAVLIYDGDCGFCAASAAWITAKWMPSEKARAVPYQTLTGDDFARLHLTIDDVRAAAWWVDGSRRSRGHLAVARALTLAGGPWSVLGTAIGIPPLRQIAALGYLVISRNRHRLPGGSGSCTVPPGGADPT